MPLRLAIYGLLLTSILTLPSSVHAWTCTEYASATYHYARARDRGLSHAALSATLPQEVARYGMHPTMAAMRQDMIDAVYAEPIVTPTEWWHLAHRACLDFARSQPPQAPQLLPSRRK